MNKHWHRFVSGVLTSGSDVQGSASSNIGIPTLFDVSYNQLSGSLPAFLANSSVSAPMRSYVMLAVWPCCPFHSESVLYQKFQASHASAPAEVEDICIIHGETYSFELASAQHSSSGLPVLDAHWHPS